jgi:hypothetical protein
VERLLVKRAMKRTTKRAMTRAMTRARRGTTKARVAPMTVTMRTLKAPLMTRTLMVMTLTVMMRKERTMAMRKMTREVPRAEMKGLNTVLQLLLTVTKVTKEVLPKKMPSMIFKSRGSCWRYGVHPFISF